MATLNGKEIVTKQSDVRWGRLRELDRRFHVGTPGWKNHYPERLQYLTAWRRLHDLGSHDMVSASTPISPSSDMPLPDMLTRIANAEALRSLSFPNPK